MAKFEVKLENISRDIKEIKQNVPTKAEMREENLLLIKEWSKEMNQKFEALDKKFVSRDRFNPVEKIAYGLVGASLLALLYGVIQFIIN